MRKSIAKRLFSGFMAAVTVLSTCGAASFSASAADARHGYPELSEVISKLDEDEIVIANDYDVPVGSEYNISLDLSGFVIPDLSKVKIVFDEAKNAEGMDFTTDHEDRYRALYHVDLPSGHPTYRVSRNIYVKDISGSHGLPSDEGSVSDSQSLTGDPGVTVPEAFSGKDGPEEVPEEMKGDSSSGEKTKDDEEDSDPGEAPGVQKKTDSVENKDEGEKKAEDEEISEIRETERDVSGKIPSSNQSDISTTAEILIDGKTDQEEVIVGASGASIDPTVGCISGGFGAAYVNHCYQTTGNSAQDRIVYCGEVDMHFEAGPHTRQNLVGASLQGHVVTEAEVIRTGLMQNYFFYEAGIETDVARGLTQRAVWAMAVGDNAASVNNYHWLGLAGLTGVYDAAKAYASANASNYVIDEAYALVNGDTQKLVYINVKKKPAPTVTPTPKPTSTPTPKPTSTPTPKPTATPTPKPTATPTPKPTSTPTPTPTPSLGKGRIVKKSSDESVFGNSSYSLAGAVYGIYSDKDCTKKITELTTDVKGETKEYELEVGNYYVKEITAPENYKLNDRIYTLTVLEGMTAVVNSEDTPEKGSVSILKTSAEGSTLPVKGTEYTVYKDKECTETAGVLTVGDDGKSNVLSLYYGTYYVKETKAAPGYMLDTAVHTVKLETTKTVELKLADKVIRIDLSTQAKNDKSKTDAGEHIAFAEEKTEITDTVTYKGLISGRTYKFKTVLMDKDTGKAVKDKNGKDVTVESELKVNKDNCDGMVSIPIVFDATALAGHSVVVFEYLYDEDGIEIGKHEDLGDEDQTIVFPKAETQASDEVTATNIVLPSENIRVRDILVYENLLPGKEYLATGTLMDKKTGKAVLDDKGNEVRATKRFTPDTKNGSVEILFTFSGVKLGGTVMVAFEKVSITGVEIMTHTDINDEDQTVYVPSIATTATDKETGSKEVPSEGAQVISDHVEYKAFPEGRYVMKGTLMDKASGKACRDARGNVYTSSAAFEVKEETGSVNLDFHVDGDTLAGKHVVVFEKAFRVKEDGTEETEPVAVHEDINDEGQTVSFPAIATTLVDKQTEDHYAYATEKVTHIDTVKYSGLIAGKKYTVKGKLVDKETGEVITDGDKPVTAEKEFTAKKADGSVQIVFTFDATALAGRSVVAFESLLNEGREVASHADINDEDQTIHYPKIGTVLTAKDCSSHTVLASKTLYLTDTVTYSNLIPGKAYDLDGALIDKETGKEIKNGDSFVKATTGFTPDKPDGTVQLTFKIDATGLAGKTLVAFEILWRNGKEVAIHADINDEAQTVFIPEISTSFTCNETKNHMALAGGLMKFTDIVSYKNLTPGKEYTVKGTLMDKETGKPFGYNGNKITAEKTFQPDKSSGTVDLIFEVDTSALAGKSVVAFEYMYEGKRQIAVHVDINDEEQTVRIPQIRTIAADGKDGDKSIPATSGAVVKDTVAMRNFEVGTKLRLEAVLVDAGSGKVLMVGGNEVRGSKNVAVRSEDDTAEVELNFDATGLKGDYVVFERAYLEGSQTPIAVHEDLKDKDQTINISVQEVKVKIEGQKNTTTTTPGTVTSGGSKGTSETVTSKSGPVKTGDTTNAALPAMFFLASAGSIAWMFLKRRIWH